MSKHFSVANKIALIHRIKGGESISSISKEAGVARKTIYAWLQKVESSKAGLEENALEPKNPKAKNHWKSASPLKEKKIIRLVINDPSITIRSIAKDLGLSVHGVWNILHRNNLSTLQQRKDYVSANRNKMIHEKTAQQKMEMIESVQQGRKVTDICKEFGVSRKTFYKWQKRYMVSKQAQGEKHPLAENQIITLESHKPAGENHWRYNPLIANLITNILTKNPTYTASKISVEIEKQTGKKSISPHGVYNILKRMGLNTYEARRKYTDNLREGKKVGVKPGYQRVPAKASHWAIPRKTRSWKVFGKARYWIVAGVKRKGLKSSFLPVNILCFARSQNPFTLFTCLAIGYYAVFFLFFVLTQYPQKSHPKQVIRQSPPISSIAVIPKAAAQENQQKQQIYTVVQGDDLWHISQKFYNSGYRFVDIAHVNHLKNPGILLIGQKLVIPALAVVQQNEAVTKSENHENYNQVDQQIANKTLITGTQYTVQHGDDLWHIALRAYGNGYKWVDIARANHFINPGIVYTGSTIIIPR